jgi:hypothetical protein
MYIYLDTYIYGTYLNIYIYKSGRIHEDPKLGKEEVEICKEGEEVERTLRKQLIKLGSERGEKDFIVYSKTKTKNYLLVKAIHNPHTLGRVRSGYNNTEEY